jgi:hypothetical protein
MRKIMVWVILAGSLFIPVDSIRIIGAFLLMTFFPGFLIMSLADPEEKNPLVFLLCGAAFLTVFVYYCSWFVFYLIPLGVSFVCVLILEKRKISMPVIDRKTLLLVGCMVFMITYLYPWKDFIDFYPPGDEMKLHYLYTNYIIQEHTFPHNYPLYPEIVKIGQPLGFHGLTAFVKGASRTSVVKAGTLTGIFMASLGCVSLYLLGRTLFSENIGIASSFSFAFLSFIYHQLGYSGSYVILAGITLQVGAVAVIVRASKQKTRVSYLLAGLFLAATFSLDMNAFFPLILFFILFLVMNRFLIPVLAGFILCSLPQLARFTISTPTSIEEKFITEWFSQNTVSNFQDVWIILFSLGPLLIIFGLLQLFSWDFTAIRKNVFKKSAYTLVGLYALPFFIPLVLGSYMPFWYHFNPVLIFRMVSIPLVLLSGVFLVELKTYQLKWFIYGLLVFSAVIHVTDPFSILPSQSPTVNEDSLSAFEWITENTVSGTSFCNFISYEDSSTWIPVICNRTVLLPFHLYYQGDNAMSSLDLPQLFTENAVLRVFPDSVFAQDIYQKYGITYLYIDEKSPVDVNKLLDSTLYELEFNKGDVYIFSVKDISITPCNPVRYHPGRSIFYLQKSYFYFSYLKEGNIMVIYYTDKGLGNVDVEINGEYVGTLYRFNSGEHLQALFLLPPYEDITMSLFPYEDVFYIDYLVVYQCESL